MKFFLIKKITLSADGPKNYHVYDCIEIVKRLVKLRPGYERDIRAMNSSGTITIYTDTFTPRLYLIQCDVKELQSILKDGDKVVGHELDQQEILTDNKDFHQKYKIKMDTLGTPSVLNYIKPAAKNIERIHSKNNKL